MYTHLNFFADLNLLPYSYELIFYCTNVENVIYY